MPAFVGRSPTLLQTSAASRDSLLRSSAVNVHMYVCMCVCMSVKREWQLEAEAEIKAEMEAEAEAELCFALTSSSLSLSLLLLLLLSPSTLPSLGVPHCLRCFISIGFFLYNFAGINLAACSHNYLFSIVHVMRL